MNFIIFVNQVRHDAPAVVSAAAPVVAAAPALLAAAPAPAAVVSAPVVSAPVVAAPAVKSMHFIFLFINVLLILNHNTFNL